MSLMQKTTKQRHPSPKQPTGGGSMKEPPSMKEPSRMNKEEPKHTPVPTPPEHPEPRRSEAEDMDVEYENEP